MEQAALALVQWAGGDALRGAWKWIIRPAREEYELSELGPEVFDVAGQLCTRTDIQLTSTQGHTLECSHFRPAADAAGAPAPCAVYLHGSGSSRLEALWVVPRLLERNVSVFAFDFAGCGHSTGDYVSLGHYEEKDLGVVLRHLRRSGVPSVALWGRSMGAAAAVLRAARDRSLAACVLDSAFTDLRTVCAEFADQAALPVPRLLVGAALEAVRGEVEARAGFDVCAVAPALAAPRARPGALAPRGGPEERLGWPELGGRLCGRPQRPAAGRVLGPGAVRSPRARQCTLPKPWAAALHAGMCGSGRATASAARPAAAAAAGAGQGAAPRTQACSSR
ncbi:unnamed protein product [Prorocentrum cordatum]|uniref:Serine aminopeptidase S33 domain-containing protein n=1 Tax=Prorocentrum cordatum TaxID=2364126 RepID=A0ABN9QKN6_9DINO|nr:unnamed protein product [Polarella glacialis]